MKLKFIYMCTLLVFTTSLRSNEQSYQRTDLGIKTVINAVEVELRFYDPSTLRVLKWPEGELFSKKRINQ